ncbi:MAG: M23 family metallopeptidase [Actinomycetota bacterium]|nr:M23 family metallopeptidase [Actinomycetota bacterium]
MARRLVNLAVLVSLLTGCTRAASDQAVLVHRPTTSISRTTSTSTTSSTTAMRISTTTTTTTPTVPSRPVTEQAYTPFATAGGVVLRHPAARVERIGFHESTLDGAQQLQTLPTSAPTLVLEGRARDTTARGAADVMVDPDAEIRAPVTGTVRYAGTYVLYCKYSDDFLVIEPDAHPGWEVKMLHIDGVHVRPGARVQAGVTVVAPRATRLPFESQVEEGSYRPAWPHVHIEIDDPNVPDRPTGPGC